MRSLVFGGGDAVTDIPDEWVSTVEDNGNVVINPPDQDVAFLWLSAVSWEMPPGSGFSPAEFILQKAESRTDARIERYADCVVFCFVEERIQDGHHLDVHHLQIAPMRATDGFCVTACLTLSVLQSARGSEFVRHILDTTWSIAKRVTFTYERVA